MNPLNSKASTPHENDFKSPSLLDAVVTFFKKEHIDQPYIDDIHLAKIRKISPDVFGTRLKAPDIYEIDAFIKDVISGKTENYLMFGLGGHGIASQAMHYYAVEKNFALFIQINSVTEIDEQSPIDRMNAQLFGVEMLYEAAKKASIPEGTRLLVVMSDFHGSGWGWIKDYPGEISKNWNKDDPILLNALEALEKL